MSQPAQLLYLDESQLTAELSKINHKLSQLDFQLTLAFVGNPQTINEKINTLKKEKQLILTVLRDCAHG
jgi:ribosomal protein L29